MTDRTDNREKAGGIPLAVSILGAAVAYVLSTGPVVWLLDHGAIPSNSIMYGALGILYMPLTWLSESYAPFRELIEWHIGLFENP